ncbi:unnamed protein product [Ixodes persulcatus]
MCQTPSFAPKLMEAQEKALHSCLLLFGSLKNISILHHVGQVYDPKPCDQKLMQKQWGQKKEKERKVKVF